MMDEVGMKLNGQLNSLRWMLDNETTMSLSDELFMDLGLSFGAFGHFPQTSITAVVVDSLRKRNDV